jgi:hypothetical protein
MGDLQFFAGGSEPVNHFRVVWNADFGAFSLGLSDNSQLSSTVLSMAHNAR